MHINYWRSKEWKELDRGVIKQYEAINEFDATDEEKEMLEKFCEAMPYLIIPIASGVEILKEVSLRGFSIYILSNFHEEVFKIV